MEPTLVRIAGFTVSGAAVRTRNADEFNPQTAKIPALWGQFFAGGGLDAIPHRVPGAPVVGVYAGYESDAGGFYDLTVGVAVERANPEAAHVDVAAGDYLVFEGRGAMPGAVIAAWTAVWTYFETHPEKQRAYLTDFESYVGPEQVQVHIGVHA